MPDDPLDPESDCFKPPAVPTEVHCLHCHEEYDSYLMEYRIEVDPHGNKHGYWCCPKPGCDGRGFGFDIFPTDPEYLDEDGEKMWSEDDPFDPDSAFDPETLAAMEMEGDSSGEDDDDDEDFNPDEIIGSVYKPAPPFNAEKEMAEILKEVDDVLPTLEEEEDEDDEEESF